MDAAHTAAFEGGFDNPPVDAANAFRAVMDAIARPGRIYSLGGGAAPAGLSTAAASLLLTLCDPETPVYLASDVDSPVLRQWIAFHTGAPIVGASEAMFAFGSWEALLPLSQYAIGTAEYPDRSATLVVEVEGWDGANATLTGPGIKDQTRMALPDVVALEQNAMLYPLGVDLFFTAGDQIAGLPRSTKITAEG